MNTEELRDHLEQAVSLTESAGPIASSYFRRSIAVDDKSGGSYFDPVTAADREVEAFLRAGLRSRFSGYGVLGEEEGMQGAEARRRWVIDPIDGTRAFVTGMPAWGILLGLVEDDEPVVGVMHQPYIGETFHGARGVGAWLRHRGSDVALATSECVGLSAAVVYSTHPDMFVTEAERSGYERLKATCRMTRFGGDCYSYCLLAMGRIDLVVEACLQPYDIIPLIPIIEAAGGVVTDHEGRSATGDGFIVAAANAALHAETLAALRA